MILLAYKHGLRASEVCNLKIADVNLKDQWIRVARLKGSLETVQQLSGHRGVPLLDELPALRAWMKERRPDASDFLFVSQKGGRLCRSGFYRAFSNIAKAAGLPQGRRSPHMLKHSIVSHLIAANTNIAIVKAAVGHKSLSSTMEYVHTNEAQVSEAVAVAMIRIF